MPDVAGGFAPTAPGRDLSLEETNQHEEVFPYLGGRCGACRFDGGGAGTGHGASLARPQTSLPYHREEESGVAAWPPQGDRREDTALPPLVKPALAGTML